MIWEYLTQNVAGSSVEPDVGGMTTPTKKTKGHISGRRQQAFPRDKKAQWNFSEAKPIIYKRGNGCQ
jgi:hypothetical protein